MLLFNVYVLHHFLLQKMLHLNHKTLHTFQGLGIVCVSEIKQVKHIALKLKQRRKFVEHIK